MPIYEYRCSACGFEKEYLQKLSDAPISQCEQCGQSTMTKLVSAAGFQLKGSGWYVTDFRNNGAKPEKSGDKSGEAAKTETTGDAASKPSTESKSEGTAKPASENKSTSESSTSAPSTSSTPSP